LTNIGNLEGKVLIFSELREALFIKKNKDRWQQAQTEPASTPDEMAVEFIQMVDDLGYAKTFYPHSKITSYLNNQCSKTYLAIYEKRRVEDNRFLRFFLYSLPLTIRKHHKLMGIFFILFILFFAVGFISNIKNPDFVRQVLGNDYVNMTEKNIEEGKPFAVYNDPNMFLMWMRIMINNIGVSLSYFLRGVFLGIYPVKMLVTEGVRIGAFEQLFFAKGIGGWSVLTVFIHGTLELTSIVIAGMAAFILGTSWLFPGTTTRLKAFKQGAMDGAKIIIGLMPIFAIAAFFESYVTRFYNMPWYLSLSFLVISALFIIVYFIVWPIVLGNRLHNQQQEQLKKEREPLA
jgi:uncharacterized membrane protein SpoIIM required for sporulation